MGVQNALIPAVRAQDPIPASALPVAGQCEQPGLTQGEENRQNGNINPQR